MTNPKRLVISSLKALHRSQMRNQFRIKAIRSQRRTLNDEERALAAQVQNAKRKIEWEVETHGDILNN